MKNSRQSRLQQLELKFQTILDNQNQVTDQRTNIQTQHNLYRQRSPIKEALDSLQAEALVLNNKQPGSSNIKQQIQIQAEKILKEKNKLNMQILETKTRNQRKNQFSSTQTSKLKGSEQFFYQNGQYSPQMSVKRALSPQPFLYGDSKKQLERDLFNEKNQFSNLEEQLTESKLIELNVLIGSMRPEQFQVLPSLQVIIQIC